MIEVPAAVRDWVKSVLPPEPLLALYIDAPADDRRWPPESFAALSDHAIECLGARTVALSSPSGSFLIERFLSASRNPGRTLVFTNLGLPQLAGIIGSSNLLVSNDTGPMHIGPALGVRTLGLFSVGLPEHFRPIGRADHFLKAIPIGNISVESVIREVVRMWTSAGRDLPR